MAHFGNLGGHCSVSDCKKQDFLPFECDCCHEQFCLSHRTYREHGCPSAGGKDCLALTCPLCRKTVRWTENQDPNVVWEQHSVTDCAQQRAPKKTRARCCAPGCKEKLGPSNTQTCSSCQRSTCLTHRFEELHNCAGARKATRVQAGLAAQQHQQQQQQQVARPTVRSTRGRGKKALGGRRRQQQEDPANTLRGSAARRQRPQIIQVSSTGHETCPECQAQFPNVTDLIAHSEAFHSQQGGQQIQQAPANPSLEPCPYCGQIFSSAEQLFSHVEGHNSQGSSLHTGRQGSGGSSRCRTS
mmetsp:Transcript_25865/g.33931  ORF Transcript_25865/g.33931 Transcript_25865/m.33931 type:complete len:299 (+) Transcript_25865:585-1481(+)